MEGCDAMLGNSNGDSVSLGVELSSRIALVLTARVPLTEILCPYFKLQTIEKIYNINKVIILSYN